jgi:YaiO family outer membrane protein
VRPHRVVERSLRAVTRALLPLAFLVRPLPASAQAPPARWIVDVASERAGVEAGGVRGVWIASRVLFGWSDPDRGGWSVGVDHERRFGRDDVALATRGYRHVGPWTLLAGIGGTAGAEFLYRVSAEAELSRRLGGGIVAAAGYRYLAFRTTDVHQIQPALAWYRARGEIQARLFATRHVATGRTRGTFLLRATYDVGPRLQIGGGGAYGERIFDVAALAEARARAAVAFAHARIGITPRTFVVAGAVFARERPAFRYRAVTLGFRRLL